MERFVHAASKLAYQSIILFIFFLIFCPYCNIALCSNYALFLLMTTSIYHRIVTALHFFWLPF